MTNYDLEERTARFAEAVIDMVKNTPKDSVNMSVLDQLIRSATSIGANYCEANGAASRRDFKNKIHFCKKEAIETRYWLRILGRSSPSVVEGCRCLWQEAHELSLIFSKIAANSR